MLLVLDVSNRETTVALLNGSDNRTWRLATDPNRTADDLGILLDNLLSRSGFDPQRLSGVVIGSVVPSVTAALALASRDYLGITPLVVGPGVRTGVRIRTDSPREVGADRIANALAAYRRYGGPVIIVDFSTATTFDVVSREGDYLGSVIAAGLQTSVAALAGRAAQLREVELSPPGKVVGTTTTTALQSGVVFGTAALVDGLVMRIRHELGEDAPVVATGRYASLMQDCARLLDHIDLMLTIDGLRLIWELNRIERGAKCH